MSMRVYVYVFVYRVFLFVCCFSRPNDTQTQPSAIVFVANPMTGDDQLGPPGANQVHRAGRESAAAHVLYARGARHVPPQGNSQEK